MAAPGLVAATISVSGDGAHAGMPRRRVGSSDGTGVTVVGRRRRRGSSGPPGPSTTSSSRSAPSAPATGSATASRHRRPAAVTVPAAIADSQRRPVARPGRSARSASSGAAMPTVVAERLGQCDPPRLFEQQHQVDEAQPEPAVLLGHGQPHHAQLGQGGPPGGAGRRGVVGGPQVVRRALLGEHLADGVAELELLLGEGEVHGVVPSAPGQPEHALGHHVALDLVGAGVDRAGQGEEVAVEPRRRPTPSPCNSASGPSRARAARWMARSVSDQWILLALPRVPPSRRRAPGWPSTAC